MKRAVRDPVVRRALHLAAVLGAGLAVLVMAGCGAPRPIPQEQRHTASSTMPPLLSRPDAYRVVRGDTLYSIAFRYGLDWRALARWNGIGPPYTIRVGDRIRLHPPPDMESAVARARRTAPGDRSPDGTGGSADESTTVRKAEPEPEKQPEPAPQPVREARQPAQPEQKPTRKPARANAPVPPAPGGTRRVAGVSWRWPTEGRIKRGFDPGAARKGLLIAGEIGQPVRAAAAGSVVYSGNGLIGYGELIIIKHSDRMLSAYAHNRERLVAEGDRVEAGQLIARMGRNERDESVLHFEIRRDGRPDDPSDYLPKR